MNWAHKVKLRHLFTDKADHASVQQSMAAIADAIEKEPCFTGFSTVAFRKIPVGDAVISPLDYANKLIEWMWDFCDAHRIWIDF